MQRYTLLAHPDALSSLASYVSRDWGCSGYAITEVSGGPSWKSAVAEVRVSDGGFFWVGSDAWGNTLHADTHDELIKLMIQQAEDNR